MLTPFKTMYLDGFEIEAPFDRHVWGNQESRDRWARDVFRQAGIPLRHTTIVYGRDWIERNPKAYHRDAYPTVMVASTYDYRKKVYR